jgi:hypothetical protein
MAAQNQYCFITEKIQQLQTAILSCDNNSVLKFTSAVVETLYVDKTGCVWIAVNKPMQYHHEFDSSFQVSLNYYRKGKPFFLNTSGIARVLRDPEDNQLPAELKGELNKGKVLLCIRIQEASYYERETKPVQSLLHKCKQSISTIFSGNNTYNHFRFDNEKNFA